MVDAEVRAAIATCQEAFEGWRERPLAERAKVMTGIGEALTARKDELAAMMTQEMGKLLSQSRQEVDLCAAICAYTGQQGPIALADETQELEQGRRGYISYQPIGLVFGIQPWNFPAYQVVRFAIASLMAGNGVLLKHASNCVGSGKLLAQIFEAGGLPEGLFTVLVIDHDQSDQVIAHKAVRGVTFTGSVEVGRAVAVQAAENGKKTVLELGSNDAYLVLSDADIDKAVKVCVQGRTYNNGEVCIAAKRFVVVDAVYDAFEAKYVAAMGDLSYGDPTDPQVKMGPLVHGAHRQHVHGQVEASLSQGARLLCGGKVPAGTSLRGSRPTTRRSSARWRRSSERRTTRTPCALPTTAASASAGASSAGTPTRRWPWLSSTSTPAWCSSTASASPTLRCPSAA